MREPMKNKILALVSACALSASLSTLAVAQPAVQKEPEGVLTLNSSATVQVPNDWIAVQFSTSKEGVDANAVQAALKDALGTAMAQKQCRGQTGLAQPYDQHLLAFEFHHEIRPTRLTDPRPVSYFAP